MGPLCTVFVDRISERIADHNKEAKSQVKNHIRTRFRFDLQTTVVLVERLKVLRYGGIRCWSKDQSMDITQKPVRPS